jgi:hypothetical protein
MEISDVALFADGLGGNGLEARVRNEICESLGMSHWVDEVMVVAENECGNFEALHLAFLNSRTVDGDPGQKLCGDLLWLTVKEALEGFQIVWRDVSEMPGHVTAHEDGVRLLWRMLDEQGSHLRVGPHVRGRGSCYPCGARKDESAYEVWPLDGEAKRNGGAHGDAAEYDWTFPEQFEEADQVLSEGGNRELIEWANF